MKKVIHEYIYTSRNETEAVCVLMAEGGTNSPLLIRHEYEMNVEKEEVVEENDTTIAVAAAAAVINNNNTNKYHLDREHSEHAQCVLVFCMLLLNDFMCQILFSCKSGKVWVEFMPCVSVCMCVLIVLLR